MLADLEVLALAMPTDMVPLITCGPARVKSCNDITVAAELEVAVLDAMLSFKQNPLG